MSLRTGEKTRKARPEGREGEKKMIKYMTAHTSIKTGRTSYRVYYDNGKHMRVKTLTHNDNWPASIVRFYTADDTIRTADTIIGEGDTATRFECFEKAH